MTLKEDFGISLDPPLNGATTVSLTFTFKRSSEKVGLKIRDETDYEQLTTAYRTTIIG